MTFVFVVRLIIISMIWSVFLVAIFQSHVSIFIILAFENNRPMIVKFIKTLNELLNL